MVSPVHVLSLLLSAQGGGDEFERLQRHFPLGVDQPAVTAAAQVRCSDARTVVYTPEQAAPYASQAQTDCQGYELFGKGRKIELLVNEGRLGFFWVLVEAGELADIRRQLEGRLGQPLCDTGDYVIFPGERVALRREPAEILVSQRDDLRAITGGCASAGE